MISLSKLATRFNQHRDEKTELARGQEPITVDDMAKIPELIESHDNVEPAD